jgi:hypothetical protein
MKMIVRHCCMLSKSVRMKRMGNTKTGILGTSAENINWSVILEHPGKCLMK